MMKQRSRVYIEIDDLLSMRKEVAQLDLRNHSHIDAMMQGGYLSSMRGRGMDFEEVRAYQAGDDIRNMDWRVTARTGKPHTKVYRIEKERPIYLLIDLHAGMYFATRGAFKSVCASRIAAMIAWASMDIGDRLGLLAAHGEQQYAVKAQTRLHHLMHIFETLTRLSDKPRSQESGLFELISRAREVIKPGSLVFLISDFVYCDDAAKQIIAQISKHSDMVMCNIVDRFDVDAPVPGRYRISNGEQHMMIDTHDPYLIKQYHDQFEAFENELRVYCRSYRIPYLRFMTDDDVSAHLCRGLLSRHRLIQEGKVRD